MALSPVDILVGLDDTGKACKDELQIRLSYYNTISTLLAQGLVLTAPGSTVELHISISAILIYTMQNPEKLVGVIKLCADFTPCDLACVMHFLKRSNPAIVQMMVKEDPNVYREVSEKCFKYVI